MSGLRDLFVAAMTVTSFLGATSAGGPASAETNGAVARPSGEGYVSVPVAVDSIGRPYIEGKIHGEVVKLLLDFTNDGALFEKRTLQKLGVEFTRTDITIPTRRRRVSFWTGEILGIEFAGRSTPAMQVMAGDVGAIYDIPPGGGRFDGALGLGFMKNLGGVLDFTTMQLHLRPR